MFIFKHGSKDFNPKLNLLKIKYFQVFKRQSLYNVKGVILHVYMFPS